MENLFRKFQDLRSAGWDTEFFLGVLGGKQWVSLHVQVGDQHFPVPPTKPDYASPKSQAAFRHRRRNGGRLCRERRRARRVITTLELLPFHLESEETTTDSHLSSSRSSVEMVVSTSPSAEMVDSFPPSAKMVDPSPPPAEMVDPPPPPAEMVDREPFPSLRRDGGPFPSNRRDGGPFPSPRQDGGPFGFPVKAVLWTLLSAPCVDAKLPNCTSSSDLRRSRGFFRLSYKSGLGSGSQKRNLLWK